MENVKEVIMPRKRYTSEQIISKLREAEVELARGKKVPQVCRQLGVTEQTYYRWRKVAGAIGSKDRFNGSGIQLNHGQQDRRFRYSPTWRTR